MVTKPALSRKKLSPLNAWAFSFACAIGWAAFVMPATFFLPRGGLRGSTLAFLAGAAAMSVIALNYHSTRSSRGGATTYGRSERMHRIGSDGALRHLDFTLLDILTMQLSLLLMSWIMYRHGRVYTDPGLRMQAIALFSAQLALGLLSKSYDGVFTRDVFAEFTALLLYVGETWLFAGVLLLLTGTAPSPRCMVLTSFIFFDLDYFVRQINKLRHIRRGLPKRKVVLVTASRMAQDAAEKLRKNKTSDDHELTGVLLLDDADPSCVAGLNVPVYRVADEDLLDEISHWWIDDAFLLLPEEQAYPRELMESFLLMGITVHTGLSVLDELGFSKLDVQELGGYKVITNSINFVSDRALLLKRLVDILGGLVGTLFTGLLCLFIAPAIYIKSPGPIFFSQKRVGQNGRYFKIHKFRSMYMDAEKRKAELMAKNKLQDGRMFKMDDDPRIIGSEKKGRDGKPRGIGNFIRRTSLDEFPQFYNVLKGEMSLVGTRPPMVDEWKQYDPHHRVRMSAKPGITGMWQVSGRSEITDFEQVVALDRYYIEHWSLWLDLKILFKTVKVVLKHDGAS